MSRVDCVEFEQFFSEFLENRLETPALQMVRSHLDACESCRALINEMQLSLALCRSFPELEPPSRLVDAILDKTSGHFQSLSWKEYLRELFRPLYMSPRFATGTCLAAISFFIIMNAFGIRLTRMSWSDLNPKALLVNIHRSVYLAYDNGVRRINDLRILYQIQSKIDELRTREPQPSSEKPKEKSKESKKVDETSSTGYFIASAPPAESGAGQAVHRKPGIIL